MVRKLESSSSFLTTSSLSTSLIDRHSPACLLIDTLYRLTSAVVTDAGQITQRRWETQQLLSQQLAR